jgi:hypothetical protein
MQYWNRLSNVLMGLSVAHSEDYWLEIQTHYEAGMGVRELSRKYNVDAGGITKKAKKQGWVHGKIQHAINEKATALRNYVNADTTIQQRVEKSQIPYVNRIVEEKAALAQSITHLTKGALSLHQMILKGTIDKLKLKEINELDAARVVNLQGLSVASIAHITGIAEQNKVVSQGTEEVQEAIQFYLPSNGRDTKGLS